MEIVIVGAGIGGLVAALALHKADHQPVTNESLPGSTEESIRQAVLDHPRLASFVMTAAFSIAATGFHTQIVVYVTS